MILDTHIVIWLAEESPLLPQGVRELLINATSALHVSVASLWEFEIKRKSGRMPDKDFRQAIRALSLICLPILEADAMTAGQLPLHHKDPFDRMIIAHAINHGLAIVTQDRIFSLYAVPVLSA